jgi:beta-N-acetylhexosaminidase
VSLGPLMISLEGPELTPGEREWLASPLLGGVILFARNFVGLEQLEALIADVHAVRSPPLLVAVDQEGGRVQRFGEPFTRLPPARELGRAHDRDAAAAERATEELAWLMAAELRAVGVDLSFAPVVDLDRGLADVIGDRAWHSDAGVVTRLARRFLAGADEAGMAATAKHFPTHAGAKADSHTAPAIDRRDYDALLEDLAPYRALVGAGLKSIMVAHVSFPAVDPLPASVSPWWIETLLRGELGFSGAVVSDDMSMAGAQGAGTVVERVVKSLDAGSDLVLVCNVPEQIPALLDALDGYVDPSAELRLTRLHGRGHVEWAALRESARWRRARALAANLLSRPKLKLEG